MRIPGRIDSGRAALDFLKRHNANASGHLKAHDWIGRGETEWQEFCRNVDKAVSWTEWKRKVYGPPL